MTSFVRILSISTIDSSPSILCVAPDGTKTLINCGEGTQRIFLEYQQKLSSVKTICLTLINESSIGGLPGMILTSADSTAASNASKILIANNKKSNNMNNGNNTKKNTKKPSDDVLSTVDSEATLSTATATASDTTKSKTVSDGDLIPELEIIGPIGMKHFIHSLRHFMRRDKFKMNIYEGQIDLIRNITPTPTTNQTKKQKLESNNNSNSNYFSISSIVNPSSDDAVDDSNNNNNNKRKHHENDTKQVENLKMIQRQYIKTTTLSYIIKTPPIQGKFLIDKAIELNIPKGKLYSELKSGKSITFIDSKSGHEKIVHSHEVVTSSIPSQAVLILYYPTIDIATQLFIDLYHHMIEKHCVESCIVLVIHVTTRTLFDMYGVNYWNNHINNTNKKEKFNNNTTTEHIFLSTIPNIEQNENTDDNNDTPFQSAAIGAYMRSLLCDKIYAQPKQNYLIQPTATSSIIGNITSSYCDNNNNKFIIGKPMLEYTLIPILKRGFQQQQQSSLSMDTLDNNMNLQLKQKTSIVETSGALHAAQEIIRMEYYNNNDIITDSTSTTDTASAEIFFTGTGSAIPCKYRNVSGIIMKQLDGRSILLDVGEGTVGQLLRHYNSNNNNNNGTTTTYDVLSNINAVWISHPHADHHLGLLRLLHERSKRQTSDISSIDPIIIIAPIPIFLFLEEYCIIDPSIKFTYEAIDVRNIVMSHNNNKLQSLFQTKIGIDNIRAIPVQHCPHSYACIIYGTSFGTIVYSGDCRPSNLLVQETARNVVDILIHEATFADGLEADAVLKKHSTVSEAIDIGYRMNAKCIVLTHFSQRYPNIPPPIARKNDNDNNNNNNIPIIFAFDFMKLIPTALYLASKLTSALRLLYPPIVDDDNNATNETDAQRVMSIPGVFAQTSLH